MGSYQSKDLATLLLEFLYTIAHWLGERVVGLIQAILPQATPLNQLVDPIGMLAVLTILVLLTQVARKVAWVVIVVGWILIIIRVVLLMMS